VAAKPPRSKVECTSFRFILAQHYSCQHDLLHTPYQGFGIPHPAMIGIAPQHISRIIFDLAVQHLLPSGRVSYHEDGMFYTGNMEVI
jgi:hypothetical protein